MKSIRFSSMKINRNAMKIINIQKFPLLKLNFCWPLLTIWVIILAHKYHICVLLFITFHLICNMSMFRDTWNLTHFSKIQIQILKKAHLGFLGSFDMLFLVLQANYCEKISLMGIFSLVSPNASGLQIEVGGRPPSWIISNGHISSKAHSIHL